ncbi:MAG TPA: DUF72 domain-containing protein [Polyangiaceae bacterium]|nr:DUF72 domain-containing protein [Polyangiaceae bacterium]HYQ29074.1 DUF72 domain-containing protein [Polyangiaceae bacterium]
MTSPKSTLPAAASDVYAAARDLAERAPLPALAASVAFGTANWSDPELSRGERFYPKSVKTPEARLRHYAKHFRVLEVDATFYALLSPAVVARWVDSTPEDFRFVVKAHPVFTGHPIEPSRLPAELAAAALGLNRGGKIYPNDLPPALTGEIERRYFEALRPLCEAQRLATIVVQFPPWFAATRGNVRRIQGLRERFPSAPFALEFRHRSWLLPERRERVFALLRSQQMTYVVADEPVVERAGVPLVPAVTFPKLALLRCHGRNFAAWANPRASIAERFNYLYSPEELLALKGAITQLSRETDSVYAIFSNCILDYAVLGAKGLCSLMHG